ncbi:hypothetical protein B1812_05510 [Methylocystis bryophila]|uniref:Uncharacterized protein n=1 Tax=Methylocystis bryophila TaxID=655015 RepID=A0A1W6MSS1_9HYPH|nr:hypothetical protein B1812_05510 [Methylocystis bryophila]
MIRIGPPSFSIGASRAYGRSNQRRRKACCDTKNSVLFGGARVIYLGKAPKSRKSRMFLLLAFL